MQYLKNIYFYLFLILFSSGVNAKDLAQVPQSEILDFYSIVSEVSPARISKDINKLANFGTRHTLSDKLSNQRGLVRQLVGYIMNSKRFQIYVMAVLRLCMSLILYQVRAVFPIQQKL